jgi:hypothetical protein
MKRTPKFLVALGRASFIVSSTWIQACKESNTLAGKACAAYNRSSIPLTWWYCVLRRPDESAHLLSDPDGEKKAGFRLADAIERAKSAKSEGGLLHAQRYILVSRRWANQRPTAKKLKLQYGYLDDLSST